MEGGLTEHKVSPKTVSPHSPLSAPFYTLYLGEGVKSSLNDFCHLLLKSWFSTTSL